MRKPADASMSSGSGSIVVRSVARTHRRRARSPTEVVPSTRHAPERPVGVRRGSPKTAQGRAGDPHGLVDAFDEPMPVLQVPEVVPQHLPNDADTLLHLDAGRRDPDDGAACIPQISAAFRQTRRHHAVERLRDGARPYGHRVRQMGKRHGRVGLQRQNEFVPTNVHVECCRPHAHEHPDGLADGKEIRDEVPAVFIVGFGSVHDGSLRPRRREEDRSPHGYLRLRRITGRTSVVAADRREAMTVERANPASGRETGRRANDDTVWRPRCRTEASARHGVSDRVAQSTSFSCSSSGIACRRVGVAASGPASRPAQPSGSSSSP